jgi:hypothetical protein
VGYGTSSFAAASGGAPFDGRTRRFTTMALDTVYPAVATLAPAPGDTCDTIDDADHDSHHDH